MMEWHHWLLWLVAIAALIVAAIAEAGWQPQLQTSCLPTQSLEVCGDVHIRRGHFLGSFAEVAAGSVVGEATATQLCAQVNSIITAAAGEGVILPFPKRLGDYVVVGNTTAVSVVVYPPAGGIIGTNVANAGVTLAAGAGSIFYAMTSTVWIQV